VCSSDLAQKLIARPYRSPWTLPQIAAASV